jgi:hypothetical protein
MKCWADSLGGCSTKQSAEHYVSKGLFVGPALTLKGLPWCKLEEKTIGLESASAKILCTTHNSALTRLDEEAKLTFDAIREIFSLQARQKAISPQRWKVKTWSINGLALERWFLKTLINVNLVQEPRRAWPGGAETGAPPRDAVEACFGLTPILRPRGIYGVGAVGHEVNSHDYVSVSPILYPNWVLAGGACEFRGFRFVLSWTASNLQPFVSSLGERVPAFAGWRNAEMLQPFRGVDFTVGNRRAQSLKIIWPPFKADRLP